MFFFSRKLAILLKKLPGKKLGTYRVIIPVGFCLGAALEFSMINWRVKEANFCKISE